jgi:hypothetical protein
MSWSRIKNQCKPINNREDIEYSSGCMTKKPYASKRAADRVCRIMARRHNKQFNSYVCNFGHKFHVGSVNEANT